MYLLSAGADDTLLGAISIYTNKKKRIWNWNVIGLQFCRQI